MMKKFKYKKCRFVMNVIVIIVIIVISIILFSGFNSYYLRYGMLSFLIIYCMIALKWSLSTYKNGIELDDEQLNIISNGKKEQISYIDIVSISYLGFKNFILLDNMVLNCGNKGNFGIESSYYNYFELWEIIIDNSKVANPNVVLKNSIKKRMNNSVH